MARKARAREKGKRGPVGKLVKLAKERNMIAGGKIMEHIRDLRSEGRRISLEDTVELPARLVGYVFSGQAIWYWITIILVIAAAASVFTIPEDASPVAYARYLLGSLFVFFFPGYSLVRALFPGEVPFKTESEELDSIERVALSIGTSIALVLITGLLLNYTAWGISKTAIMLSLLALTLIFSTAAIMREKQIATASD